MKPRSGSATEFVLQTLRGHPDRELRLADLDELAAGRFQKENMGLSLKALLEHGLVVKTKEGIASWWAISQAGPEGEQSSTGGRKPKADIEFVAVEVKEKSATPKVLVKRPSMTISSGRW